MQTFFSNLQIEDLGMGNKILLVLEFSWLQKIYVWSGEKTDLSIQLHPNLGSILSFWNLTSSGQLICYLISVELFVLYWICLCLTLWLFHRWQFFDHFPITLRSSCCVPHLCKIRHSPTMSDLLKDRIFVPARKFPNSVHYSRRGMRKPSTWIKLSIQSPFEYPGLSKLPLN